jgi:hypothetical protein
MYIGDEVGPAPVSSLDRLQWFDSLASTEPGAAVSEYRAQEIHTTFCDRFSEGTGKSSGQTTFYGKAFSW